jgi:hypothetical protein
MFFQQNLDGLLCSAGGRGDQPVTIARECLSQQTERPGRNVSEFLEHSLADGIREHAERSAGFVNVES